MRRYGTLAVLSILSVLICFSSAVPARCDVIHGVAGLNTADMWPYGLISNESFDFATRTVVPINTGDLSWNLDYKARPWLEFRQCYATIVPGTLEDLQAAPTIGGPLLGEMGYDIGPGVYVVRTSDGLYESPPSLVDIVDGQL